MFEAGHVNHPTVSLSCLLDFRDRQQKQVRFCAPLVLGILHLELFKMALLGCQRETCHC